MAVCAYNNMICFKFMSGNKSHFSLWKLNEYHILESIVNDRYKKEPSSTCFWTLKYEWCSIGHLWRAMDAFVRGIYYHVRKRKEKDKFLLKVTESLEHTLQHIKTLFFHRNLLGRQMAGSRSPLAFWSPYGVCPILLRLCVYEEILFLRTVIHLCKRFTCSQVYSSCPQPCLLNFSICSAFGVHNS